MDQPFTFELPFESAYPSRIDHHTIRKLSSMRGQFQDQPAYEALLSEGDRCLYEVYEITRPEEAGELLHGVSVLHPGKVGQEYFMTKGHFHVVIDTAEIYYCLKGEGKMVMETPEGAWAVEDLAPGRVLYVPPRWAHRSVNTNPDSDLVTFFIYPGNAGHDYGSIEAQGFRKLVLEEGGAPIIVDNPRWLSPEARV